MKLIVNENFQFRGVHREGTTITVSENFLKSEIEKGKHKEKKYGKDRWLSGILEHCTPANQETADFINSMSGEKKEPASKRHNEKDDSVEILDIRSEFDILGKAYDKRWQLKRLRREIIKARIAVGDQEEAVKKENDQMNKDFKIGDD